jgi:hypothetical protein
LLAAVVRSPFRSLAAHEAEVLFLRQQLTVLQRSAPKRVSLRLRDKLICLLLYRLFPCPWSGATIFRPEALIGWHRPARKLGP